MEGEERVICKGERVGSARMNEEGSENIREGRDER